MIAVCAVVTAEVVAVNATVVAPLGTVTDGGTETALLPLVSVTVRFCCLFSSVTVHASVPAPVMFDSSQERLKGLADSRVALADALIRTCARPDIASEQRMNTSNPARQAWRREESWTGEHPAKERKNEGARRPSNITTPQERLRTRPRFALARLFAATPSELTHESVVERRVKRYPIIPQ
jgi:hypothetical protein